MIFADKHPNFTSTYSTRRRPFNGYCETSRMSVDSFIAQCPPGRDIELDRRHRFWLDELVTRFPVYI